MTSLNPNTMMLTLLILSVAAFGYLFYAIVKPEKF